MLRRGGFSLSLSLILAAPAGAGAAADWPQWRCDAGRTACTAHALPETLSLRWTVEYSPREPAWEEPLNRDLMPYDSIFEPVASGKALVIGFNDTDKVVALDTETGNERWRFYAAGPVRLPPAIAGGKVYVASDDGCLYCLALEDGSVQWKVRGGPSDRRCLGNRRLISLWPARGGPVVEDRTVYFAAGIWPFMGTSIYALDAATGAVIWCDDAAGSRFVDQPHNYPAFAGIAPQGPLVARGERLFVPGGRSVPACFERATGKQLYFHLAKYGKTGGSSVFAEGDLFFAHERGRDFSAFSTKAGLRVDPLRGGQPVLDGDAIYYSGKSIELRLASSPKAAVWKTSLADATGDLIKAGDRLYAGGKGTIAALDVGGGKAPPAAAWTARVEGTVARLLAADDKLFAVTLEGRIMAFAAGGEAAAPTVRTVRSEPAAIAAGSERATAILEATGAREGYAVVFGAGDGSLIDGLLAASKLVVIAVEPGEAAVDRLRRRWDDAGSYGRRIAVVAGDVASVELPPYLAELAVVAGEGAKGLVADEAAIERLFSILRPYGGTAWLAGGDAAALEKAVRGAGLANATVASRGGGALLTRGGPLPGAGTWTHQYGSMANTVSSSDALVKLPLGILWFGGASNEDVLPRHGHGPPEQVVGGRLFIEGMDSISARDVYTGRNLWKTRIEGLNPPGTYFDDTYRDDPLTTSYGQLHLPGANARGTNFVVTADLVYAVAGSACHLLDVATGRIEKTISLAVDPGEASAPAWAYVGVAGDSLIGGRGFVEYSKAWDLPLPRAKKTEQQSSAAATSAAGASSTAAAAPDPLRLEFGTGTLATILRFADCDRSASRELVAMDRHTGRARWRVKARHGFLHNGIAAGGGLLFCLDKLPAMIEKRLARRGTAPPATYRLLALDLATGAIAWEKGEQCFGSWLAVSEAHDVLLQATRPSRDALLGEEGTRMMAYRARTGERLWNRAVKYGSPPIIHGRTIITDGGKYDLATGEALLRAHPLTGERAPWSYTRSYGCNYPIASGHLLTFRSSSAGFCAIEGDGGVGHFGGFKSGCTSSLIAADGVLNAPDYTRTCSCSFQNQASLALTHMPDVEVWTHNDLDLRGRSIERIGINFGAPGDRLSPAGTLWLEHPVVGGPSPKVQVAIEGETPSYFRRHSSRLPGDPFAWIGASGLEGSVAVTIALGPRLEALGGEGLAVLASADDAEEGKEGAVTLKSTDLELTTDKVEQVVGIRFDGIDLAQDARIEDAWIQFTTDEPSADPTTVEIRGQAADDAPPFAERSGDISSRPRTAARVSWSPRPWQKKGSASREERTPGLRPVIHEIIGRPGWRSGGAVAFLITGKGKRVASAYDGDRKAAPRLVIHLEGAARPLGPASTASDVRLYFAEPDPAVRHGDRVFDVVLQGNPVLTSFDVLAEAGGTNRTVVKEIRSIELGKALVLRLLQRSARPPILCGLEVVPAGQLR